MDAMTFNVLFLATIVLIHALSKAFDALSVWVRPTLYTFLFTAVFYEAFDKVFTPFSAVGYFLVLIAWFLDTRHLLP